MKILPDVASEVRVMEEAVRAEARRAGPLDILEAGCGKGWPLSLDGVEREVIGIDTDLDALRIREERLGVVGEVVEADLRTVRLPEESFDVAYCSFVLEHVAGAEDVLDKLVESLRPGGLLMVRIPDGDSVYGFVTRHTPHSTHVAFKRYVKGQRHAGKPGFGPYPVVYDDVISTSGISAYCSSRNLDIESLTGSNFHLDVFPKRLRGLVDLALRGVARLSFGRLSATHNNICLIARKADHYARSSS